MTNGDAVKAAKQAMTLADGIVLGEAVAYVMAATADGMTEEQHVALLQALKTDLSDIAAVGVALGILAVTERAGRRGA